MVESSRSITAAVITAPNATQRNLLLLVPALPVVVATPAISWLAFLVSAAEDIRSSVVSPVPHLPRYRNEIFCSKIIRTEWFVPVPATLNFMTETNAQPGRPGRHGAGRSGPMSGRQAEAARNDQRILESARAVFVADPGAPITAVAKHAGVGISALYTRYGSKEELLRTLCTGGLQTFVRETEAAIERVRQGEDRWPVFADFMRNLTDADTSSLTRAFAGKFAPTPEMFALANRSAELSEEFF